MSVEKPLVTVITVNYNQLEVTCDFLQSLRNISYPNIEVFVVDNASKINPEAYLHEHFPEVQVLVSPENLGFAGGNNLAVVKATGKYVLYINNDTEVEPGFLEPLVEVMEADPAIGLTTSKLVFFHDKTLIQYAGSGAISPFTGRGTGIGRNQKDTGQYDDTRPTEIAHGASMMASMKMMEEVGMMADLFFLYYEEIDWCEMIKRAGYKIYYVGTSKVYHKESISVGKYNAFKTYYMMRNRILFVRRNTRGLARLSSFLFISLIAIPKNLLVHLFKGEFDHARSILRAVAWNLTHFRVFDNPKLPSRSQQLNQVPA